GAVGISKNVSRGLELLSQAVEARYPPAASLLAQAYLHGFGVHKDRQKGMSLIRQAAEWGNSEAQLELGTELVEAEDSALAAEGVKWLQAAAGQGLHTAHYALGLLYREGKASLPQDIELAQRHIDLGEKLEDAWYRSIGLEGLQTE